MCKDFNKVSLEYKIEPAKYLKIQNGEELVVSCKIGAKLQQIKKCLQHQSCYAPEESVSYILSGEEVVDQIDPNRGSDAYLYANPELDITKVTPLSQDEKDKRFSRFVEIANMCSRDDVLKVILEKAPKKKNGMFAKNKLTVVAALPIVFGAEMRYYEIAGKAKDDNLLELTIQERRFSEEEWLKTKEIDFLKCITGNSIGINEKNVSTKVKLRYKGKGTNITIEVPAVQLQDGALAIDAKPYRPISNFSCVKGNDKDGYMVVEPENPVLPSVVYDDILNELNWDISGASEGMWATWISLPDVIGYIRTGNKKYWQRFQIFTASYGKIDERCMTENYIAEIVYQMLCVIESINSQLEQDDLADKIIRGIKALNEADKTNRNWGGSGDFYVSGVPGRKKPIVSGKIIIRGVRSPYRISYSLSCPEDDWSEYDNNL